MVTSVLKTSIQDTSLGLQTANFYITFPHLVSSAASYPEEQPRNTFPSPPTLLLFSAPSMGMAKPRAGEKLKEVWQEFFLPRSKV